MGRAIEQWYKDLEVALQRPVEAFFCAGLVGEGNSSSSMAITNLTGLGGGQQMQFSHALELEAQFAGSLARFDEAPQPQYAATITPSLSEVASILDLDRVLCLLVSGPWGVSAHRDYDGARVDHLEDVIQQLNFCRTTSAKGALATNL